MKKILLLVAIACLTGCGVTERLVNPFHEDPSPNALLGDRNTHALDGTTDKIDSARAALEQAGSYESAHLPSPNNPVMRPAVVRLMWIPDHLNKSGDLVPAHFYYVKVLQDRWAVSDAFELESQLGASTSSSNIPYVLESDR